MYYGDYQKVKKMELLLQKLAYISVGLDFLIALATVLILRGANFSHTMLLITGYLMTIEMAVIGVVFAALMALKHYSNIMDNFALAAFKNIKVRRASSTLRRIVINPIILIRRFANRMYNY